VEDVFRSRVVGRWDGSRGAWPDQEWGDEVESAWVWGHSQDGVTGVEMFRKLLDYAQAGDNVGFIIARV